MQSGDHHRLLVVTNLLLVGDTSDLFEEAADVLSSLGRTLGEVVTVLYSKLLDFLAVNNHLAIDLVADDEHDGIGGLNEQISDPGLEIIDGFDFGVGGIVGHNT